jgi:transposase
VTESVTDISLAPQLLTVVGIGPDTAVTLLITIGDNPEHLGSEASFAALCGVSPVERSSGSRQYRRAASKEGKTRREIVRCLKRYAAREVFHLIRVIRSCPPP